MIKRKKVKNTADKNIDVKTSTMNLMINVTVFFLLVIIIYLTYSIFANLKSKPAEEVEVDRTEVPAEIIQVEVLNGCGVSGLADRFTDYLRSENVDVVSTGNYISFDIDKTMIIDRTGNKPNAKRIAELLGVPVSSVITQKNENYFLDVSIIIGRDYYKLNPLLEGD